MDKKVDTALLSQSETDEYRRRESGKLRVGEEFRVQKALFLCIFIWFLSLFGSTLLVAYTDAAAPEPNPADDGPIALLLLVLFGGLAALVVMARKARVKRERYAHDFLETLDYDARVKEREDRRTIDRDYAEPTSRRERQRSWYGDGNSDLSRRDRELGEALGIPNGDIYKANWRD